MVANGVLTGALSTPFEYLEERDPVRLAVLTAIIHKAVALEKDRIKRQAGEIARALSGKR